MAVKASDTITLAKVDDGENGTDGRVFLTEVSASVVKAEAEKTLSPSYLTPCPTAESGLQAAGLPARAWPA